MKCSSTLKLAFVTPVTGGAGFIGTEQVTWAKFAVKRLAPGLGLKIRLIIGDTPVEQGAAIAQTLAQKYVADKTVVGVIGPSTSGAVAASSKTYADAGIAHISSSATRTSLTKGTAREATSAFFRVVPGDYIQGPSDAHFMIDKLKVKKVVILDFQEPYSVGLADAVERTLKAGNVSTSRLSVANTVTDFSSFVTRVPNDADIVFFPTQKPAGRPDVRDATARAGQEGEGLRRRRFERNRRLQGDRCVHLELRTGHQRHPGRQGDHRRLEAGQPGQGARVLRPADLRRRAGDAARDQEGVRRRATVRSRTSGRCSGRSRASASSNWILGGDFRFSTKSNDPLNAKFYIFQIQSNGSYKLVG